MRRKIDTLLVFLVAWYCLVNGFTNAVKISKTVILVRIKQNVDFSSTSTTNNEHHARWLPTNNSNNNKTKPNSSNNNNNSDDWYFKIGKRLRDVYVRSNRVIKPSYDPNEVRLSPMFTAKSMQAAKAAQLIGMGLFEGEVSSTKSSFLPGEIVLIENQFMDECDFTKFPGEYNKLLNGRLMHELFVVSLESESRTKLSIFLVNNFDFTLFPVDVLASVNDVIAIEKLEGNENDNNPSPPSVRVYYDFNSSNVINKPFIGCEENVQENLSDYFCSFKQIKSNALLVKLSRDELIKLCVEEEGEENSINKENGNERAIVDLEPTPYPTSTAFTMQIKKDEEVGTGEEKISNKNEDDFKKGLIFGIGLSLCIASIFYSSGKKGQHDYKKEVELQEDELNELEDNVVGTLFYCIGFII